MSQAIGFQQLLHHGKHDTDSNSCGIGFRSCPSSCTDRIGILSHNPSPNSVSPLRCGNLVVMLSERGNRNDKLAALAEIGGMLIQDRLGKAPGQNDDDIRLVLVKSLGVLDRDSIARRKSAVTNGIVINQEIEQLANLEMMQQRRDGCRCAIARNGGTTGTLALKIFHRLVAQRIHPLDVRPIHAGITQASGLFQRDELADTGGHGPVSAQLLSEGSQRTALTWTALHVKQMQAMTSKENVKRFDRVIAQVLVVDEVEYQSFDRVEEVEDFEHEDTVLVEEGSNRFRHVSQVVVVSKYVVGGTQFGQAVILNECASGLLLHERVVGWNACGPGSLRNRGRRIDANNAHAPLGELSQESAVVAANVHSQGLGCKV